MRRFATPLLVVVSAWAIVTTAAIALAGPQNWVQVGEILDQYEKRFDQLERRAAKLETELRQVKAAKTSTKTGGGRGSQAKAGGKGAGKGSGKGGGKVVRTRRLEVVNESGEVLFRVSGDGAPGTGGTLKVYNKAGAAGVVLSAGKDGGVIHLLNNKGKLKKKIE